MRCDECEFTLNECLRLCDARCLAKNEDVDFKQLRSLVDSEYFKKNLPNINIFFHKKAAQMMKHMFSEEKLMLVCLAVYKGKLSDKQIEKAKTLSKRVDEVLNYDGSIKDLILSL